MNITPETRVGALLDAYPELLDFLVARHPEFSKLKNPILRKTVAKMASLSMASTIAGVKPAELVDAIKEFLTKPKTSAAPLSKADRAKIMKEIILELHAGGDFETLKNRFTGLVQGLDHSEIAEMEQALMKEGMPAEEITRLCSVHAAMFEDSVKDREPPQVPAGHPLHWYMEENRALERLLSEAEALFAAKGAAPGPIPRIAEIIRELGQVNTHYARKENQLFSVLERHGVDAPSKVMWAVDDEIRAAHKSLLLALPGLTPAAAEKQCRELFVKLREMVTKEEQILFHLALDTIPGPEWQAMKQGDREIGFAWIRPGGSAPAPSAAAAPADPGLLNLNVGQLPAAVMDLILNHLPLDISFVDEHDKVCYYNQGLSERIFPRSPAVIGREVRNCHPPKSLAAVEKILVEFKAGTRDSSEFWISSQGRFLHIRYFAVRDHDRTYRGTLEVTQDVTAIRALSGERRILDWN